MTENAEGSSKPTIMIIDDTLDNLYLFKQILSRRYRVSLMSDGEKALAAIQVEPPDLILLDIMMPFMDGFEVAARLKADPQTSGIPIIYISALDDVGSKVRAFTSGGVDYITKPIQAKEVLARVETHLTLRNLQRDLQAANSELARQNECLRDQIDKIEALQAELREQAIRDPLTGAYNRRYLKEILMQELARARRGNYPVSVVMFDVDHLKQINDSYGHQAGDQLLQQLIALIQRQIRVSDAICRYGGDEFVILMPDITLENAHRRAEQCRVECEALRVNIDGLSLGVTISVGVASNQDPEIKRERLLNLADQAVYMAKRAGRNRTVSWVEP